MNLVENCKDNSEIKDVNEVMEPKIEQIDNVECCELGGDKGGNNVNVGIRVFPQNLEICENLKRGGDGSSRLDLVGNGKGNTEIEVRDKDVDEVLVSKVEQIEKVGSCLLGGDKSGNNVTVGESLGDKADCAELKGVENPKGEIGRWNLTFEEWLQLPESSRIAYPNSDNNYAGKTAVAEKVVDNGLKSVDTREVGGVAKVKEEPDMPIKEKKSVVNEGRLVKVKLEASSNVENQIVVKKEIEAVVSAEPISVMPIVKKEVEEIVCIQPISARPISDVEYRRMQMVDKYARSRTKERISSNSLSAVVIETGEFPDEEDWLFVGRSFIEALSTTRGRKLENNEIVNFTFPDTTKYSSSKAARAAMSIVRFSTKRNGEIGRLPLEWANWLIPLVNSNKVKVFGRCIDAPPTLDMLTVIVLYASFYIHSSVITKTETSSWKIEPTQSDSTKGPLLELFEKLKLKPFEQAEFTPKQLDSRKRSLNLEGDMDEVAAVMPSAKRGVGSQKFVQANKDEQAISEASLNKIVGAVDVYDLKEMDPPATLSCDLKPYQKQALYWMTESEKGVDAEEAEKILHPCWEAYRICDKRAPAIYLNIFSGEMTTKFPTATLMARGGILADAMGLGKTVMTIALILARRGRGMPYIEETESDTDDEMNHRKKRKTNENSFLSRNVKGSTLIICPMALLGQWKNELEAHTVPDSISIFVHYERGRRDNAKVLADFDVVLTTYGVLQSAYKSDGENSVFHRVDWYRVVLDEAHTIKNSKSQCAQAAYTLPSYSKWCLTGTPIQNSLEDLFSLLCFLHVEPWCNWAWWNKYIKKPYENGDQKGLKLIKAILRPLMLRRSKETKDSEGRPILVLPPTDIQILECEQSEAERDFYDALFRRSKVQFDQFVAQGKVLHNYANILELLLRLRQCCNHPFLVMSRSDNKEYADLNKLARKFLETNPENATQKGPSKAYVEEVVEGIRKGENSECPICMESPDDPVLTPCAHKMCRECLLTSWRSPAMGYCPICRQLINKTDLITCPSQNRFRVDIEKNWKESSKITKLMKCLEQIHSSSPAEKSIVFSQWTSFLDLLELPLKRRKIEFLRFDGQLSQKHRERVLAEFNENKEKKVLLMSLKAGGVGLNLTAASNVFIMDPWWNPAVEEQAIMRIHRIGQKRTVRVRRLIVKETVEERMQQVQTSKQNMIAGALTDEDVRSARIQQLKMLFRS
ncbi:hypothetical protein Leryth_003700 [Lithospermum erythrorhizon]|nr:hypothetical protein Leryth_003700 [Lithospermum erythrorhizon]